MRTRRTWRIGVLLSMIFGQLLGLWAVPAYAQQSVPPLPHAFFGNLTINGSPAPIGIRVEARGTGINTAVAGNPIITTTQGKYGGPDLLDPKLNPRCR